LELGLVERKVLEDVGFGVAVRSPDWPQPHVNRVAAKQVL
jgi:hypothetical protein